MAIDLTTATLPGGITVTRTGGTTVYAQDSASHITATTGGVFEDRGNNLAGWWSFGAIPINQITAPFDHTDASWTKTNSPTLTHNAAVAPDGTTTADELKDTSTSLRQVISALDGTVLSTPMIHSTWVRDSSPVPSTRGGIHAAQGTPSRGKRFPGGNTWTRVTAWHDLDRFHMLEACGYDPATNTQDATQTGAVYVWGDYYTPDVHDYPLVTAASAAQTIKLDASTAASLIPAGDLDLTVSYIPHVAMDGVYGPGDAWIWSTNTPDGLMGVKYVSGSFQYRLFVRGVDVTSTNGLLLGGWTDSKETKIRASYKPSTGKYRLQVFQNGCCSNEVSGNTTGGALAAANDFLWLGSNLGASPYCVAQYTKVEANTSSHSEFVGEFCIVGDSISEAVNNQSLTASGVYSLAESRTAAGITTLAHRGDKIADQKTKFLASAVKGNSAVKAFTVMIGVNDIATGSDAITVENGIQDLINTIHTNNPSAKIILCKLTPAKTALTGPQYAVWQAVNTWITGGSPTSVDRVDTAISDNLNDGADDIIAIYTLDHLHPINTGRDIMAAAWRADFQALGVWNPTPPPPPPPPQAQSSFIQSIAGSSRPGSNGGGSTGFGTNRHGGTSIAIRTGKN